MHVTRYSPLLGTDVEIAVAAPTPAVAEAADRAALTEIQRLTAVFSVHDESSELCRWRRAELDQPSPELAGVLAEAERWHRLGDGAFHPAAAALRRIWLEAEATGRPPTRAMAQHAADALRTLPYRTIPIAGGLTVRRTANCRDVDLNAIAKGHIVDRATAAASAVDGVRTVVVNAGGDLRHAGAGHAGVTIEDPHAPFDNAPGLERVRLAGAALATSGSTRRGFRVGGTSFGHVLDPRTGWPAATTVSATVSATVRAPTALVADAVATIALVLAPAEAVALVESLPEQVACLVVAADGARHRCRRWPTR